MLLLGFIGNITVTNLWVLPESTVENRISRTPRTWVRLARRSESDVYSEADELLGCCCLSPVSDWPSTDHGIRTTRGSRADTRFPEVPERLLESLFM